MEGTPAATAQPSGTQYHTISTPTVPVESQTAVSLNFEATEAMDESHKRAVSPTAEEPPVAKAKICMVVATVEVGETEDEDPQFYLGDEEAENNTEKIEEHMVDQAEQDEAKDLEDTLAAKSAELDRHDEFDTHWIVDVEESRDKKRSRPYGWSMKEARAEEPG